MGLRRKVVDLVRLHLLHDVQQRRRICHIAVVQNEALMRLVRILIDMVNTPGIKQRGAPFDPVYLVSLTQQKLRQIRPILPRDACDQRLFH